MPPAGPAIEWRARVHRAQAAAVGSNNCNLLQKHDEAARLVRERRPRTGFRGARGTRRALRGDLSHGRITRHIMATSRNAKKGRRSSGTRSRSTRSAGSRSTSSRASGARGAKKRNGGGRDDAIALLKADHREVEQWFGEFESARSQDRKRDLAERICAALRAHTTIEEEIFYPAFLEATDDTEVHHEAEIEHAGAKHLIDEIEAAGPDDDHFDGTRHRAAGDDSPSRERGRATRRNVQQGAVELDGPPGSRAAARGAQARAHGRQRGRHRRGPPCRKRRARGAAAASCARAPS